MFRNKLVVKWNVIRNKAQLVAKAYNKEEGIYYNETFALVARLHIVW